MHRISNTWLSLFLALIMGLLPFSQTMAGYPTSTESPPGAMPHTGQMEQIAMDHNNCGGYGTYHSCDSASCACYQCGTCSATILLKTLTVDVISLTAPIAAETGTLLPQHPFLLYRPPRA